MSDNPRGPGTVPPPASPVPPAARPIQSAGQAQQPAGDAPGTVPLETTGEQGQGDPRQGGPRRVRLTVSQVDPWSIMKLSFLLSIAVRSEEHTSELQSRGHLVCRLLLE